MRDIGFQSLRPPKSKPVLRAPSVGIAVFKLSLGVGSFRLILLGNVVLRALAESLELGAESIMLRLRLVELRAFGSSDHSLASASNSLANTWLD